MKRSFIQRSWAQHLRFYLSGLVRPTLIALIAWSALLLIAARLPDFSYNLIIWARGVEPNYSLAGVALVIAALLVLVPAGCRLLRGWLRPEWTEIDTALVVGVLIGGLMVLLDWRTSDPLTGLDAIEMIVAGLAGILGFRVVALSRRSQPSPEPTSPEPPLFDQVLAGQGLAPLRSESEDELERGKLLDELHALLAHKRETSINFGLEGTWGSGKTSLLRLLKTRLEGDGLNIVALDLWSYREPERLIQVYFEQLATAIEHQAPQFKTRRLLRRFAAGLVELGGDRVARAVAFAFGDLAVESLEDSRRRLTDTLSTFKKPLLVFLDDLDRLDRDELLAVFRAVRLMSDLPNLTQVLAYDREQVAHTLFPTDPAGTRARDYIAKIVGREFTITTPHPELAESLLESSLNGFLGSLEPSTSTYFRNRVQWHRPSLIIDSLPTPREIRRVAAATAERWELMAGHLNVFDLFVLTIIENRFPSLYRKIRSRFEWFVELRWTTNPHFAILERNREEAQQRGQTIVDNLKQGESSEDEIAAELLEVLFPNLRGGTDLSEEDARRERRIFHPSIIGRYFHLYMPPYVVSEKEIEEYARQLRQEPSGKKRRKVLQEIIAKETELQRLDSFLDQWRLVFGQHPSLQRHEPPLVQDLAIGLAQSAEYFSDEQVVFGKSQMKLAAFHVHFLSYHLLTEEDITSLLVDSIRHAARLSFAGTIVGFADKDRRPNEYHDAPEPDKAKLEEAMARKVSSFVADEPTRLLELNRANLGAAIFGAGENKTVDSLIQQALQEKPLLLPRLLELAVPIALSEPGRPLLIEEFNAESLAKRLDLQEILRVTQEVPLSEWTEQDQELVRRFREWMQGDSHAMHSDA